MKLATLALSLVASVVAEEESKTGFRLTVDSGTESIVCGQPVTLKIRLVNTSTSEVSVRGSSSAQMDILTLYVGKRGDALRKYEPPEPTGVTMIAGQLSLKPGASIEYETVVFFNEPAPTLLNRSVRPGYAFEDPGWYSIRAVLESPALAQPLSSANTDVQVESPAGTDALVWQTLKSDLRLGRALQTGGTPAGMQEFEAMEVRQKMTDLSAANESGALAPSMKAAVARLTRSENALQER